MREYGGINASYNSFSDMEYSCLVIRRPLLLRACSQGKLGDGFCAFILRLIKTCVGIVKNRSQ